MGTLTRQQITGLMDALERSIVRKMHHRLSWRDVGYVLTRFFVCPFRGHKNVCETGVEEEEQGVYKYRLGCLECQQHNVTGQVGIFPGFFLVQIRYEDQLHDYCIMRKVRGKKSEMILRNPKGTLWENRISGVMKVTRIPKKKLPLYLWMGATSSAEKLMKEGR